MSQPLTVARVIEKLPSRFIADQAAGLAATFQFCLHDEDDFYLRIEDASCQVIQGQHADPDVTLIMDSATMIAVITGEKDGMSAFLTGKLRAEGDVMLATRLGKLFSREKQR